MRLECLARECARDPLLILADFLRTPLARLRYGQATIYPGDCYYLPYYTLTLHSLREKAACLFLGSALCEDVGVSRLDAALHFGEVECDASLVLEPRKTPTQVLREIDKKIRMNRRLRRAYGHFRPVEPEVRLLYAPMPSFLVKCRQYKLFLVDALTEKVDFRHLALLEERFVATATALTGGARCCVTNVSPT